MRLIYKLSGRLKFATSIFERTLISNINLQRNVCGARVIFERTFNSLSSSTFSFSQPASVFSFPYQRNIRWYSQSKPTEISYEDLLELIDDGGIIIDVRSEKEANGNGLIPQARNIPLEELKEALSRDPEDFERIFKMAKPSKKAEKLVFYAHGPVKSSTAVELAQKLGFKKARHYPGGWKEWSEKQVKVSKV